MAVLIAGYIGDRYLNKRVYAEGQFAFLFPNPLTFLAVMLTGLYLSLFQIHFLVAAIGAWLFAFVAPGMVNVALSQLPNCPPSVVVWISIVLQLALAALMWWLVTDRMSNRSFVTHSPGKNS